MNGEIPGHCQISGRPRADGFADGTTISGKAALMTVRRTRRAWAGLRDRTRYRRQSDGMWVLARGWPSLDGETALAA